MKVLIKKEDFTCNVVETLTQYKADDRVVRMIMQDGKVTKLGFMQGADDWSRLEDIDVDPLIAEWFNDHEADEVGNFDERLNACLWSYIQQDWQDDQYGHEVHGY
jgi:hypothetical protein